MRAALLTEYQRPLALREIPDPSPGPNDAVVRLRACGVCRSDWHVWNGDWLWRMTPALPHVLGHELAGDVAVVGSAVTRIQAGDRVTCPFHLSCGECAYCRSGATNRCVRYSAVGFDVPGGFAEYVRIPLADVNLVALPAAIDYAAASALGCRYMSAYHALLGRGAVSAGEWVVVFGAGGVGLAAIQIAAAHGARVIAVDLQPAQLQLSATQGACAGFEASPAVVRRIRELTGGGADLTVDALGTAATTLPAIEALRKGGRHLRVGLTGADERGLLSLPMDLVVKNEIQILGSIGCPHDEYERLLTQVSAGRLDPGRLIESTIALGEVSDTLEAMSHFGTRGLRVITTWQ